MDLSLLPEAESDFERVILRSFREGLLRNRPVCLLNAERMLQGPRGMAYRRILRRCIRDMGGVVFASGERASPDFGGTATPRDMPPEPDPLLRFYSGTW
jgi:hypothetical protein